MYFLFFKPENLKEYRKFPIEVPPRGAYLFQAQLTEDGAYLKRGGGGGGLN